MPRIVEEVEHGIEEAYYNNLPYQHPEMRCSCGVTVEGDTWEDCGAAFDEHLEED